MIRCSLPEELVVAVPLPQIWYSNELHILAWYTALLLITDTGAAVGGLTDELSWLSGQEQCFSGLVHGRETTISSDRPPCWLDRAVWKPRSRIQDS